MVKSIFLLFLSSMWLFPNNKSTQNVDFKITNIRNTKGNIVLCFFNNSYNYQNGQPCIRKEIDKDKIVRGELQVTIPMPQGIYGVVLLDDENLNDKMDYSFLLPTEGFGFSNHYPMIRKPTFNDFDFTVSSQQNSNPVIIKIKYI